MKNIDVRSITNNLVLEPIEYWHAVFGLFTQ